MNYAVQHGPDIDRILALPRRDWRQGLGGVFGTAEQLVWGLTRRYARPEARERGVSLRACQAVGLAELHDFRGLFAPLQVGAGKTLITFLAPLACKAERPVLLVPARHREKTLRAWDEYARDWVLPGLDVRTIKDGTRTSLWASFKIISGGQTGADRGGLDAARELGLIHGGKCPRGRRADDGRIPDIYALQEMVSGAYPVRTEANICESDATIIVGRGDLQGGSLLTWKLARSHGRPCLYWNCDNPQTLEGLRNFIRKHVQNTVNIAGPRESSCPGIQTWTRDLLIDALQFPRLVVESYERVSRDPDLLADLAPDLLLCDEAHCLANPRAAVTKRVRYALEAAEKAGVRVRFVPLSGTQTKRSIKDYAHLARWSLGRHSPLPLSWPALQEWASYLDEETLDGARPQPGALVRLVPSDRQHEIFTDPVTVVRQGFGARCAATPGWVSVTGQGCEASLEVALVRHQVEDNALFDALTKLRSEWVLPDGRPFCDALEFARHMRELSCGFFYRWVEEPPAEWSAARKAWRQFISKATEGRGAVRYDTEMQVAQACARGALDSDGVYPAWRAIRDTYKLVTEPVWVSDEVLRALIEHVEDQKQPTIVWSGHVAVLEKLSELSQWPLFGAGKGARLEEHVNQSDQHVIASINACADGFNLQSRALSVVLGWPRAGKTAEQLIGRTHRDPTTHDAVRAEAFCATIEAADDLIASWRDARYIEHTTRTPQKLIFCDKTGWNPEKEHDRR